MTRCIVLDSAPVGLLSNPARTEEVVAITNWSLECLAAGHQLYVPEVIDYEVRRELLRAGKANGVKKLDALKALFGYLPITTEAMRRAAELWAESRRSGNPTGDPKKLDIDVILAAQALTMDLAFDNSLVVATPNVRHLSQFVTAEQWSNIVP